LKIKNKTPDSNPEFEGQIRDAYRDDQHLTRICIQIILILRQLDLYQLMEYYSFKNDNKKIFI